MRRVKIDNIETVRDTVEMITGLIPKDLELIQNTLDDLKISVSQLSKMKHVDYVNSRKQLKTISNKCQEIRNTILETHKIFTQDKSTINDKL